MQFNAISVIALQPLSCTADILTGRTFNVGRRYGYRCRVHARARACTYPARIGSASINWVNLAADFSSLVIANKKTINQRAGTVLPFFS